MTKPAANLLSSWLPDRRLAGIPTGRLATATNHVIMTVTPYGT